MRGPRPDRSGSSSFRPSVGLLVALLVGVVLLTLLVGVAVGRWRDYRAAQRPDLGPGPIQGVRLVEPRTEEVTVTCPGVPAGLPTVRLVEPIPIEQLDICLTANRFPPMPGQVSQDFRLNRSDGDGAAAALADFAAAYSRPDVSLAWWRDRNGITCPAVAYPSWAIAITVGNRQLRVVSPTDPCGPRQEAVQAASDVAAQASPVSG